MTSSRHVRWLTAGVAIVALTAAPAPSQAQSFYTEAGKPYAGTTIRVLDEITPLQETLSKIVPEFEKETGIKVEWELLNHFEVISKGQADMVSGPMRASSSTRRYPRRPGAKPLRPWSPRFR